MTNIVHALSCTACPWSVHLFTETQGVVGGNLHDVTIHPTVTGWIQLYSMIVEVRLVGDVGC